MKLYVCSATESLMDDIDGIYYLVTEKGECLASHWCSSKWYAKGDLYERRPERIKEFTEKYGKCECLFLGEDDMTAERLITLNIQFNKEREDN